VTRPRLEKRPGEDERIKTGFSLVSRRAEREPSMTLSVSIKPSSLSAWELFQLGAVVRYPGSSRPVATWLIRESLCLALFGGLLSAVVGFLAYPEFSPTRPALRIIPVLLGTWLAYLVLRLRSTYRANRTAEVCIVELSEDGVSIRNRDSEWRTRWKPDFEIAVTPRFVIIGCGKTKAGIPRKSFASPEAEDEFVRAGRRFQAAATGKPADELVGGTSDEV
jgi:hypothetical protein